MAGANIKGATEKFNWDFGTLSKILPDYYFNGYNFRAPNTRLIEFGTRGSVGINRKWGASSLAFQFNKAFYGILDGKDIIKNPDGSIVNKDTTEKEMFPKEAEAPYHAVTDNKISSKTTFLLGLSKIKLTLGYQNNNRTEFEDNGTKAGYKYVGMTLQSNTYDVKWYLPTWKKFSTIIGTQGMYQQNKNDLAATTQLIPNATINDVGFVALTKLNLKEFNLSVGGRYDTRNLSTVAAIRDSTVNMPSIIRNYSNVSGSIGATYDIEDHLLLRANFATGYRTPNLNELMSNGVKLESRQYEIGNLNFVKEQNNELDFNIVFKSNHFTLEAAAYLNTIKNFIYLTPTGDSVLSNLNSATNAALYQYLQSDVQIKGGEASINIHPANISWLNYQVKASTLAARLKIDNSYLPMMPTDKIYNTLMLNFKNGKKFKNVFFRVATITALDQFRVAANEQKTTGYTLLNASFGVTKRIWKFNDINFVLAANNILDRIYLDNMSRLRPFGVANPGLNIVLSLKIPFDIKSN